MARVSEDLANATVLDPRGSVHVLSSLWKERSAVLVFMRHFA
jgi:hypothetical protein